MTVKPKREHYMVLSALRDSRSTLQVDEWGVSYVELAETLYQLIAGGYVLAHRETFELKLTEAGLRVLAGPMPDRPQRSPRPVGEADPVEPELLFFMPDS